MPVSEKEQLKIESARKITEQQLYAAQRLVRDNLTPAGHTADPQTIAMVLQAIARNYDTITRVTEG
jgi:hypothetical protein